MPRLWLLLPLLVTLGALLGVWIGCRDCFGRKRLWLVLVASVPALLLLLFAANFAARAWASRPYHVYRCSFDLEPTADVVITNSLWVESDGSCLRYLQFYANQSTIDRIIAAGRVRPDRSAVFFGKADDPGWWKPSRGPKTKVYTYAMYFRTERSESGSQVEILIYNPSTREAYYRCLSTE